MKTFDCLICQKKLEAGLQTVKIRTHMLKKKKSAMESPSDYLVSERVGKWDLHGEENLKELMQEITSKALQTDSALRHTFEREVTF